MLSSRVIPCLLLSGAGLVKTVRFAEPKYVGDPRNAVKIFNEKEVDELVLLDIRATRDGVAPRVELIREILSEAFMPVAYGGGIRTVGQAAAVLSAGVEKIVVASAAVEVPGLVGELAREFGSQSVIVCLDVRHDMLRGNRVYVRGGTVRTDLRPAEFARKVAGWGAGEILVNAIHRDGRREGYDLELIRSVVEAVDVPVVACGGAGSLGDLRAAVADAGASAACAGSLFVFRGKHRAVLIDYPTAAELKTIGLKT